ncbi:uncharacterized protein LOC135501553 [Lineus longissimus]|uniref:uncharacterized protein LOC135501553 n=1 Tax=Lineus longissimus TaxID=88925 RepID=UPI002B4EDA32
MPVKPEPPDVLYVTESGDGQLTASALPPPDGASHQPVQQVLPPPPSLVPRPQLTGFHPAPVRIPSGFVPGPPPIRMPPRIPSQQLPNRQSIASLPQGQTVPQMMTCQMMGQVPPDMPGQMYPLPNGQMPSVTPMPPVPQMPVQPNEQPASQPITPVNTEPKVAPPNADDDKDAPDSASRRGIFGWSTISKENLPVLFRKEEKFVAVRMVEFKLLSRFPNMFPEKLKDRPPLHSFYATEHEVKLLNEINYEHCDFEFGHEPFSTKDLVVKLQEFEAFYDAVEQSFPQNLLENMKFDRNRIVRGGWVQINNTVVPYLYRQKQRFVPLKVIRYAATLLISPAIDGQDARQEESDYLNHICKDAGISFDFDTTTKLVSIDLVCMLCQPIIHELPSKSPFENAKFVEVPPPQPVPPPPPLHGLSNMMNSIPYTGVPPNVTIPQSFPRGPAPQLAGPASSAVRPPASVSSQLPSSGSATTHNSPPVVTNTGASPPGTRAPPMHSLPCPRHPGSYMFGGGNAYFQPLSERFPGGPACPTSDTGVPSTKQSPPITGPTPLPTSTQQQMFGPSMFPPGHRGYMPPPYMYPGHMMPPHGMPCGLPPPYQEQPTGNKNKETAANRRRRSSENSRSRGSTPVQFQPDRRSSGDIVSPTAALSRTSSTDSLNNAGTSPSAVPRPGSRGSDTPSYGRASRQGDLVIQTTLPSGNVPSSSPNPPLGPRPSATPLPILNVPSFSSSVRPSISQAPPFPNQNLPGYGMTGYGYQPCPVYSYQENMPTLNVSSASPMNSMPGVPVSVPGNLNPPTTQLAATGQPVPVSLEHIPQSVKITTKDHFGVTLPTVQREGSEFALIEDVVRQCFPLLSMPKFLYAVEDVLCVPLQVCTAEIERSFISNLMNLNGQLQCSKLISIEQLKEYLPQLKYMFKENVNPLVMEYFEKLNSSDSVGDEKTEASDNVDGHEEVSEPRGAVQTIVIDSDDDDTPSGQLTASKLGTCLKKSGSEVTMKIKRKNSATAERIEEIISAVIEQYSKPEPGEANLQTELQSKAELQSKLQVCDGGRMIVKTSEELLSAQAKADNLLSCISKQTQNDDDTQVPVNTDGGSGDEQTVEERVKQILNDAQKLKDKEDKILLSLVKANGASNKNVQEFTPKIVETVSLAEQMENVRSIQDDAAPALDTLKTKKPCSVESVSLHPNDSEVSQGSTKTVCADAIIENTDNQQQNSRECNEQNNNFHSKIINNQSDASGTVETVSESLLSSEDLGLKDVEKRRLSGECEPRILNTQSLAGQIGGKSLKVGETVSLDSPEGGSEAVALSARSESYDGTGLDATKDSSVPGDCATLSRCQLKVVDVVSLSESKGVESSVLWDNWDSDSNMSGGRPIILNRDTINDIKNGPSLSSVEPEGGTGDIEVLRSSESCELKITETVSLAKPVEVQKSVKDSGVGANTYLQGVELESVPTSAAGDKSMEPVTTLDSSAENDGLDDSVVVISEDFSRKPSNSSNKSCTKSVSPVSGVLSENNQDSCLKIVSVVGGCDRPGSCQNSTENNHNVTTSESGRPKVLSVGSKSKIVIAPSTSQKFHVSILNQGIGVKRSHSDSCDAQPSKRIMIKVENNNNPIKQANKDETVIIKHNANDGSVTEVVCID